MDLNSLGCGIDRADIMSCIRSHFPPTPIVRVLEREGQSLFLKLETMQPTGSFKVRGVAYRLSKLAPGGCLVANSAGNHGLALAHFGRRRHDVHIVLSAAVPAYKQEKISRNVDRLIVHGQTYDDAEQHALDLGRQPGYHYISPYNDPLVIAGQASMGFELLDALGEDIAVIAPIGGGGMASGLLLALRQAAGAALIGVEAERSNPMTQAILYGELRKIDIGYTIAEGLAGNIESGSLTYDILRTNSKPLINVSDQEIRNGMRFLYERLGVVVEAAGAVAVASFLAGRVQATQKNVVAIVSGRNIAIDTWMHLVSQGAEGVVPWS